MSTILFANNAQSTLAGSISNTATSVNLASGGGALFPSPGASEYFVMTFIDAATGLLNEIVHVTARSGDTCTIVRGQEGTTALNWSAGDIAANLVTAGTMDAVAQYTQSQAQAGNYAVDSGITNAYVVALDPPLSTVIVGMPIRVKIANTNTGASTLNPGPGALPIVNPDGTALGSGAISSGGVYTFTADGAGNYQLVSASNAALSSSGVQTTGDMKFRPTAETLTGYTKANAQTIGGVSSNGSQLASASALQQFSWLWTNFSNTQCPTLTSGGVPVGRGASAAADFAANRQITLLDWRGVGPKGLDTMGNSAAGTYSGVPFTLGNSSTAGAVAGENTHALSSAENGTHAHGVTDPQHLHTFGAQSATLLYSGGGVSQAFENPGGSTNTGSSSTGISINNSGSGTAHNTVDLSMLGTWYIKL